MFIKSAALVLIFLIRFCFPHLKSLAEVVQSRCGQNSLKKIQKVEKTLSAIVESSKLL